MKSVANVRDRGDWWFADRYLIIHYRVTDILNETSKFIGVVCVVDKAFNLSLFHQWREISMNILQFPSDPRIKLVS